MPLTRDCRESTYKGISSLDWDPSPMAGSFLRSAVRRLALDSPVRLRGSAGTPDSPQNPTDTSGAQALGGVIPL
jgi:hypothetical protein